MVLLILILLLNATFLGAPPLTTEGEATETIESELVDF